MPIASQLLTKPLAGIDGHGGGDLFTTSDPQYTVFINWFRTAAANSSEVALRGRLVSVSRGRALPAPMRTCA